MGMPAPISPLKSNALAEEITTLYAHINAATARLLELIAHFDEIGGYAEFGAFSTAHWLTWACGIGAAAAREKVRVARALRELPEIRAAFRAGAISYSKVRAITRVATPACESTLLDMARHATAAETERIMSNYRQALHLETPRPDYLPAEQDVYCLWDHTGCLVIRGRLGPEKGALFQKAFQQAYEKVSREAGAGDHWQQEQRYPAAERRVDALVMLAESGLEAAAGDAGTADRYQVTVHVSAETLGGREAVAGPQGELPGPDELARIDQGPAIEPERARRLCCDGSVVPILLDAAGEVLNVGRKTRTIPPAVRRALAHRDGGCCRFPGCMNRRGIDNHHVRHWAQGGETRLDNLVSLCRRHHALVHEGGYGIRTLKTRRGLDFEFIDPEGRVVPKTEDLRGGDWETLVADVSAETPGLHAAIHVPELDRDPPDYDHIAWWTVNFMQR